MKWATCNVGAGSPEEHGSYFAWGETNPKKDYSVKNQKYRIEGDNYDNIKFSKYVVDSKYGPVDNKKTLVMSDDAARARWGGCWRMPTDAEFQELIDKCTWTWTTMDGKEGYKVVSTVNGNSIFLPCAGRCDNTSCRAGRNGSYWSSSLNTSNSTLARYLYFDHVKYYTNDRMRCSGQSVRPVFP